MHKLCLLLALSLINRSATGQSIDWVYQYPFFIKPKSLLLDNQKNVIVVGDGYDIYNAYLDIHLLMVSKDGALLWKSQFDQGTSEEPHAACLDLNNNIYVAGHANPQGILVKFNANGEAKWAVLDGYQLHDVVCLPDANILVAGNDTAFEIKVWDTLGVLLSEFAQEDTNYDRQTIHLAVDSFNQIVAVGKRQESTKDSLFVEHYSFDGQLETNISFKPSNNINNVDYPTGFALDKFSNVIVVGTANYNNQEQFYTAFIDSAGTFQWIQYESFDNDVGDFACDAAIDDSTNAYVAGYTANGLNSFAALIKYDAFGNKLWEHRISGIIPGLPDQQITIDPKGDLYLVTARNFSPEAEIVLQKISPDGNLLWEATYPGIPYLLEVDDDLNIYVCGIDSTGMNTIVVKYSQLTGEGNLWTEPNSLLISPNPLQNTALLSSPQTCKACTLELYDLPGRTIRKEDIQSGGHHIIQRSDLSSGIYIIKLIDSGLIIGTAKIIIQ